MRVDAVAEEVLRHDAERRIWLLALTLSRVATLLVVALLFCVAAHAQRRNDATAELFGRVNGAKGDSAVLHLRTLDENPVRYYDGYEEIAAKDGTFHFAGIAPGKYRLEVVTSGFTVLTPEPITLRAGERRRGVVISVVPGVSLCGRVTENGAAKANAWVTAYRYNPEYGTLSRTGFPATQTAGSFLIPNVAPGMYYLESYGTFYPGSRGFNGARPIVVGVGTPKGCPFVIPLQYTGCQTTKVSGRIASVPGDSKAKYRVLFLETNPAGGSKLSVTSSNNDVYQSGDSFSSYVCPGDYAVVLSEDQPVPNSWGMWDELPSRKVVFDRQHVEVRATPIQGVLLTPQAMASISGEVPGMTHNVACPGGGPRAQVRILREGDGQFQTTELDDKNRFSFRNVAPGVYTIYFGPVLREAFYLDSILVDGKPARGRKFTITQAQPVTMVINISSDLANAKGHLSPDERREPRWEVAWTRPKGVVEGRVSGGKSGTTVKLRAVRYNSNASGEYVTQAAADGSFRFDAVDPGVYTLRVEGKGILTTEYGALEAGRRGTPIVVERGAHLTSPTFVPPRLSAICGRVTTSEGVPQVGRRIFLQSNQYSGIYGSAAGLPEGLTDGEGRFRIDGLYPGEYFLASPLDVNRTVFFSGDGTLGAAAPVRLQDGKDIGCGADPALDLRVPPDYRATYSCEGRINGDLPAIVGDRFWVTLLDESLSGSRSYVATASPDAEHRFRLDKVPGGKFRLELYSAYGPPPMRWSGPFGPVYHLLASQMIEVHDRMTEVTITPMQLPVVTGTVRFDHLPEAWGKDFSVMHQHITLFPPEHRRPSSAQLSADGSFRIAPVDPGDYMVDLNLPALYVKSVRLGGREIQGRYFHLNAGASANLDVEVSGDVGRVNARVVPDGSLPKAEPSVRQTCSKSAWQQYDVVLFPDPLFYPPTGEKNPNSAYLLPPYRLRGAVFGGDTAVSIEAVPPGRYRALAMQFAGTMGSQFGSGGRDALTELQESLWNQLAALGEPVTVQAGGTVDLALPDRTIDVVRVAARLGVPLDRGLFDWRTLPDGR